MGVKGRIFKAVVMGGSRLKYLGIYRASLQRPGEDFHLVQQNDCVVTVHAGPVEFIVTSPHTEYEPPAASVTLAQRKIEIPDDCFVIIAKEMNGSDPRVAFNESALRVAELASLFDLLHPQLLIEKCFEGVTSPPGSWGWVSESPATLNPPPAFDLQALRSAMTAGASVLMALPTHQRERYQLASRWFRRGHEVVATIDKFVCWWTVLEVYPAEGSRRVPEKVAQLLARDVYPTLSPSEIKDKIGLGRICGFRGEILHRGKAFIHSEEEDKVADYLDRLRATAATCMRLLAGMKPGGELNEYVK